MEGKAAEFGPELRGRREAAGLSLVKMAALMHYSKSQVSKVESGKVPPTPEFALAADRVLGAGGELAGLAAEQPRRSTSAVLGLPATTRHFTGRRDEVERLGRLLCGDDGDTVAVVTGMAGVGKTALVLRAAWETQSVFSDGCLFLDLRGHTPRSSAMASEDALDALLRMLGVSGADIPHGVDGRANLYRSRLRGRRMLLVLDNASTAAQVRPLLPAEARCRVLVTSRNRLHALDDAEHLVLDELPAVEAVRLFRSLAGPDDEEAAVRRVVDLCGRLPLAVRIAAARRRGSAVLSVAELERALTRLVALDDGERSVVSAFAVSVQGLTGAERGTLALLGLHPGTDVGLPAIGALAGRDPATTEEVVRRLDYAGLVTFLLDNRVRLHDLVRQYLVEHLLPEVPVTDQDAALLRLLTRCVDRARAGNELIAPSRYHPDDLGGGAAEFASREDAVRWLDTEWRSLTSLCRTAATRFPDQCWRLAYYLRDYFFLAKLWDPWISTHEYVLAAVRASGDRRAEAITLNNLGMAHSDRGDLQPARSCYEAALELFRQIGDQHGAVSTGSNLAWVDIYLGSPDKAVRGLEDALERYRAGGEQRNVAITLRGMALAEVELGQETLALAHLREAEEIFGELGLDLDVAMTLNAKGWVCFRAASHAEAERHYLDAVAVSEAVASEYEAARARLGLGNVAAALGDFVRARAAWEEADRFDGILKPLMVGEARARLALDVTG
ncbi:tetratricopeptide repeat protein [Lentzea sp. NPDC051838]|uniref:tetratricopeptide repeat protein n=1 Tax=Lentzea sp. NPDC051838 TaxID=3154849 RepID=UPI00343FA899